MDISYYIFVLCIEEEFIVKFMFISVRVLSEGDIGSIIFVYIFKNYSLYVNGSVLFIR